MAISLIWAAYASWIAFFAILAWRGRLSLLFVIGAVMIVGFAAFWAHMETAPPQQNHNRINDLGSAVTMTVAAAVLIVPLVVAAIAYPLGRLWAR